MPAAHPVETSIRGGHEDARPTITSPITYTGSLDSFQHQDLTPVIGREFTGLQIAHILESEPEQRDRMIRDVAVTGTSDSLSLPERKVYSENSVSQRGVVFLRDQNVTHLQMKDFCERLSTLAGCVS